MPPMLWFILAVILVIAAVALFVYANRKAAKDPAPAQRTDPLNTVSGAQRFGPDILGPGAIVTYGAIDYVVRGTITVTQGYYVWWEHLLDGGSGAEWLGVEVDEGQLKLTWWQTRPDLRVDDAHEVTVDGVHYRTDESGVADFTTEGTTGLPAQGTTTYRDLREINGHRLLSVETWGGAGTEVSTGSDLLPGELTVYPAPEA